MDIEERMQDMWGELSPQMPASRCPYAAQFAVWTEALCSNVEQDARRPTPAGIIAVNQGYVLLLTKFFEWWYILPKVHRTRLNTSRGHTCVFQVFEAAFQRLKALELSLTPPLLFLPPAPPPAPPPRIAAIGLGILEEE
jgi:hypothetical protein